MHKFFHGLHSYSQFRLKTFVAYKGAWVFGADFASCFVHSTNNISLFNSLANYIKVKKNKKGTFLFFLNMIL